MEGTVKKILIVDDDESFLNMLESKLYFGNYSVVKTSNGQDAVRLAREEKPDLIVLDVIMPHPDGLAISVELKKDIETRDIPIFFLTAAQTKDEETEQIRGEVRSNLIFAKPIDSHLFLEKINEILSK